MIKNFSDVSVLEPSGDLGRREIARLCETIDGLMRTEWVKVVLNLEHVTHLHYAAIQDLIHSLFSLKVASGDLRLARMNAYHRQLFQIAGIEDHFECYETLEEAVLSYESGGGVLLQ
ncbi:MAG: STAS domain-containing protein [bacterium]|nr:STAS domain-containing protein [bacterium]